MQAALAAVGVDEHFWLPYHDGSCDTADAAEATAIIRRVLDEVEADTVVTFGPDGMTGHPDHIAVSAWATAAVDDLQRRPRLLYATKTSAWADTHAELHRRLPIFGPDGPPALEPADVGLALELRGAALRAQVSQRSTLTLRRRTTSSRLWAGRPTGRGSRTSSSVEAGRRG